jgi:glycosyltransferase involved in cell wall biosynthesis
VADGVEGRLVAADRPAELARAIRILLAYPQLARTLGDNGRRRIARELGWHHSLAALDRVYDELAGAQPPRVDVADAGTPLALAP